MCSSNSPTPASKQATWVFVSQQYDPGAVVHTDTDSAAAPFKPMPWLRLNPSRNARECFRWTGRVSAQAWARRGGAEYSSPCVSVRPTNAYLLVPQVEDVLIAWVELQRRPRLHRGVCTGPGKRRHHGRRLVSR